MGVVSIWRALISSMQRLIFCLDTHTKNISVFHDRGYSPFDVNYALMAEGVYVFGTACHHEPRTNAHATFLFEDGKDGKINIVK